MQSVPDNHSSRSNLIYPKMVSRVSGNLGNQLRTVFHTTIDWTARQRMDALLPAVPESAVSGLTGYSLHRTEHFTGEKNGASDREGSPSNQNLALIGLRSLYVEHIVWPDQKPGGFATRHRCF